MKKLFIISASLLGVVLFFLVIYNVAFRSGNVADKNSASSENKEKTAALSGKGISIPKILSNEKLLPVSDEAVIAPTFTENKEHIKYYSKDGQVWQIEYDGRSKRNISDTKLENLIDASWSPDKGKILTHFANSAGEYFYMYDYSKNAGNKVKDHADTVVWDNMGAKIIYKYYDAKTKERSLNVANPDGSEWKKLADLEFRDMIIRSVPQTSLLSYWNKPKASEQSKLTTIGFSGGEAKTIFSGRYGADYLWSPSGDKILISSKSDPQENKVSLGYVTMDGKYSDLGIPTFASKCVWSSNGKTVYYALPSSFSTETVLPDDYESGKILTKDTFWKVDIQTGKKERIIGLDDLKGEHDAKGMFLSPTEDALYFIDRSDSKLYRIGL